jgi:hypothetical protein
MDQVEVLINLVVNFVMVVNYHNLCLFSFVERVNTLCRVIGVE